jgi:hypothetical protein
MTAVRSSKRDQIASHWQAWWSTSVVDAGQTRTGKPRQALCTMVLVAHSIADMRALRKRYPQLKFVEVRVERMTPLRFPS